MFVSYAQNFEDVILWRALRHVEDGFYIDVGAQDPLKDSVSRGLYEQGWRGVHVEANAHYAEKLRQDRPDEEVIEVAVDREPGEIAFFEVADTGLSTGDPEIARRHEGEGRECREVRVKSTSLAAILDRYADRSIHWLKIDVEGMEEAVVDGWPPSDLRPWVVVIESTLPGTQELSHHGWEPKLLALGYEFVYFDGLNRFYVSEEHHELKDAFGVGPNIFDGFKLAGSSDFVLQDTEAAVERDARIALEEQFAEVQTARTDLENDLASERERSAALEQQVVAQLQVYTATERQLREEEAARLSAEDRLAHEQAERARIEDQLVVERQTLAIAEQELAAEQVARADLAEELASARERTALLEREMTAQLEACAAGERQLKDEAAARLSAEDRLAHEQAERVRIEDQLVVERQALAIAERELAAERDTRNAEQERLAAEREAQGAVQHILSSERNARLAAEGEMALEREQRIALERRINALTASRSWRITAPARKAVETARWFKGGVHAWLTLKPGSRPRRTAQRLATGLARRILASPRLSRQARRIIGIFPLSVEARLRSLVMGGGAAASARSKVAFSGTEVSELSSRAREIYALILMGQNNRKPS